MRLRQSKSRKNFKPSFLMLAAVFGCGMEIILRWRIHGLYIYKIISFFFLAALQFGSTHIDDRDLNNFNTKNDRGITICRF